MAYEIEKHHEEIDEVFVLHLRSERNLPLLDNPSAALVQGDTIYDAIRAIFPRSSKQHFLHDPLVAYKSQKTICAVSDYNN